MPTLKLRIINGKNFPEGECFCKINYGKDQKLSLKTKPSKKSSSPEWNETFSLVIEENEVVVIEVHQSKSLGRSQKIGTISIDKMGELIKQTEKVYWEKNGLSDGAELQISLFPEDFGKEKRKSSTFFLKKKTKNQ